MDARGPDDIPDPRRVPAEPQGEGPAVPSEIRPAEIRRDASRPADPQPVESPPGQTRSGPVLSLEERKAARAGQKKPNGGGGGGRNGGGPRLARVAPRPEEAFGAPEARPASEARAAPAARPAPVALPEPAGPARPRLRHWAALLGFLLVVVLPTATVAWYLWERAAPRYVSMVGFSVRTENSGSAMELLGGMMELGAASSTSDTDILYRFIQSQEIVRAVDERLDLRGLWAKGNPEVDPIFAYHPPGTIEDLHDHWQRMVSVYNDSGTGLLDVEVQAFAPEDARAIAQAVYEESQALVNRLSGIAQADTSRFAREELDAAVERLKNARAALTRFRNETQIVDPQTSLQSQMGLLSQLEQQLAQALIDLDLLRRSDDPRIAQAEARVEVIEARMDEERAKLGLGRPGAGPSPEGEPGLAPAGGTAFADLVGQYESLMVDQEFAQQAYVAALAAYDGALAESRQQSRYLAAHVEPTLAERADQPQRGSLVMLTALFGFLAWVTLTLMGYALRDRR